MILSDRDIRAALAAGRLRIDAPHDVAGQIGPASMDFRLGTSFKRYKDGIPAIDPEKGVAPGDVEPAQLEADGSLILKPGDFVLGVTAETITLGRDLVARCEGRSSLGRLGLIIHSTAGFIDPGFSGTITLEITNINHAAIRLRPGMRVGQFSFESLSSPCERDYAEKGGKYMHQTSAQESRIGQDAEFRKGD